jgi:NAD(P)H-quinone oxidoreductase subunit 3
VLLGASWRRSSPPVAERVPLLEWPSRDERRVDGSARIGWDRDSGTFDPDAVDPSAQPGESVDVTNIWYIVGFLIAGISFVFLTIGASWLITHRNRGDVHKGLPYESGIDTYGDTHGRFGLSFYIYALLFVAFDIEVVFIYLWAIIFRAPDVDIGALFISMFAFVGVLLLGLAYAWRKGVLAWR